MRNETILRIIKVTRYLGIAEIQTCSNKYPHYPQGSAFRVVEIVNNDGVYITWPGVFSTEERARQEIENSRRKIK